ncbi:MAG TPA: alpha/beta hydrolase [Planctomycetota bacterium]
MWKTPPRKIIACALQLALVSSALAQDPSVRRDGFDLHYRTSGSGTPAVFLSGGPGCEVDYVVPIAEHVPTTYQRVFLEQRGTGRSKPPAVDEQTMTLRLVVEDLEALRVHLQQERLLLIGHSWGGMLAMAYAASFPSRVEALILIGTGGPTLEFQSWFGDNIDARMRPEDLEARRYWEQAMKRGLDPDKAMTEIVRAMTPAYFFDRAKGLEFAVQVQDGFLHMKVNTLLFQDMRKSFDLRPALSTLDRPVLIVHGHQDPIGDKTVEDIHRVIPRSKLHYIHKSGHFPWLEQPEAFRGAVEKFLEEVHPPKK